MIAGITEVPSAMLPGDFKTVEGKVEFNKVRAGIVAADIVQILIGGALMAGVALIKGRLGTKRSA